MYLDFYNYKFTLVYSVIDTTKTWTLPITHSDRDEYDDENRIVYQITEMGVDASGFYYKWYEYYYDTDAYGNVTRYPLHTGTQRYSSVLSGDFVIDIQSDDGASIDDSYAQLFSRLPQPYPIVNQQHVTAEMEYDTDGLGITYLKLTVTADDGYEFSDDTLNATYNILNDPTSYDPSIYIQVVSQTTTKIIYRIELYVTGVGNYNTCAMINLSINYMDVIKNPLDISESYIGCSGSNTASTIAYGGTYINTLTASTGYIMDGADIHVYMGGVELDNVYDPLTQTITIATVTGDIVVTVSAVKQHLFRFFSSDGNTLFVSYTGVSITSLQLSISGTQRTLIINGSTNTYTAVIPTNYGLHGLAFSVNPTRYDIPLNIVYTNPITQDTDFYEVITQNETIPTTFTMNLFQNKAEKIRVDKSNYLTSVGSLDGTLRTSVQITKPTIRIELSGVPNFNYVYIPQFNRYYYVDEIVSVSKDIWDIVLSVDVLMSFKDTIRSQCAFVERNQFVFDPDIEDNKRSYEKNPEFEYVELPNTIFDVERTGQTLGGKDYSARIVITVVGEND